MTPEQRADAVLAADRGDFLANTRDLIADAIREAVAEEREAIAEMFDDVIDSVAAAIRTRSTPPASAPEAD